MTQYKKYLEGNYTKATIEAYFKEVTIFNNFFKDREINRSVINEFKIYLMEERKISIRTVSSYFAISRNYFKFKGIDVKVPEIKYIIRDIYYGKELTTKEINRILAAAKEKDGWLEIRGRTNFKSNEVTWTFACKNSKCTHKTVYNLK